MTGAEVEQAAILLSGKLRHNGSNPGAITWLVEHLRHPLTGTGVHKATVYKWVCETHRVPSWAVTEINRLLAEREAAQ